MRICSTKTSRCTSRGEIVVVIEADFADGHDFGMRQQLAQTRRDVRRVGLRGVVRMNAHGGQNCRIAVGQANRRFEIGRSLPVPIATIRSTPASSARSITASRSASKGRRPDGSGNRSLHDSAARPPGTSSRKPASTGFAAFDATPPRSCRSIRCRAVCAAQIRDDHYFAAHQFLRLVGRGDAGHDACAACASPISTFRCSSLSAPFTGSAESTWATRRSTFAKSSMVIVGVRRPSAAGGGVRLLAHHFVLPRLLYDFQLAHLLDGGLSRPARG